MRRQKPDIADLEARLGHAFRDRDLLERALTHVSAVSGVESRTRTYQRLEFLGDRVLGMATAELLYAAFPAESEGELSRRLAELVRRETCAAVALAWDAGAYLKLGAGEAHSGGRRNTAILADACEALIGAAFLDGGYGAARGIVERAFGPRLQSARGPVRDAKTALQEWAQGQGRPAPIYALVERVGPDHAPNFRVAATIDGIIPAEGEGASKRAAEQAAALALLRREGVWTETDHG